MRTYFSFILLFLVIFVKLGATQSLPTQTSVLFSGSGNCAVCHEAGSVNSNILRDKNGNNIAPPTHWRSTMMGSAAKDPFWRAKVSAEVSAYPQFKQIIKDKCTTCHAPMGRTEAINNGQQSYSVEEMANDPLAMDGVSCTVCHQIKDNNLGKVESFSGHYVIENDHLIYGPYQNPFGTPMQMMSGYTPVFGEQVHESEICATCHTLFTPTVDNDGNITGEAPEQTPYLEWKNSKFPSENIQCQTCHMPEIEESVVIANRPPFLNGRSPFAQHYFVGGNVFMLKLLKANRAEIGVTASAVDLDSSISRTLRLLQQESAKLTATPSWINSDTLVIKVAVKNLSGHKFPTGYPSRRSWLYVNLQKSDGQSVFKSGSWDSQSGEIDGLDSSYETHHDVITKADQVQIYQSIMEDVDGKVNYTLLRAAGYLKDNRLPPEGFISTGVYYDSTAILGLAKDDSNFNRSNGIQGSGVDTVTYKIGGLNNLNSYQLGIKLFYQSLDPKFVKDLLNYSTPEVNKFNIYYQNADKSPVKVDSLLLTISPTKVDIKSSNVPVSHILIQAYPNPFNPITTIQVKTSMIGKVEINIYNLSGKKIHAIVENNPAQGIQKFIWDAKDEDGFEVSAGQYFVEVVIEDIRTNDRYRQFGKIVYLK
jgi:hypothetical protein